MTERVRVGEQAGEADVSADSLREIRPRVVAFINANRAAGKEGIRSHVWLPLDMLEDLLRLAGERDEAEQHATSRR